MNMAETRYDVPFPAVPQNTVLTGPCVSNTGDTEIVVPDWQKIDRAIVLMALMVLHRHLLNDYIIGFDPELRFLITDRAMALIEACKSVAE